MPLPILLGALAGAVAGRIRGTAWGKWYGRAACALLISVPVALHWPWGTAAYLPVAGASFWAVCLPHDPSGRRWLLNVATGIAFTLPAAVALDVLLWPDKVGSVALVAAGALKAACYLLPESDPAARWIPAPLRGRFLWRDLAFNACCGAAPGWAVWPTN